MNQLNQLSPDRFEPAEFYESIAENISTQRVSFWGDVWRRFRKNRGAVIGLLVVLLIGILAVVGPLVSQHTYYEQRTGAYQMKIPQRPLWFRNRYLGRDLWTRTWYGASVSLLIALLAALIDLDGWSYFWKYLWIFWWSD